VNIINYQGYAARIEYSDEDGLFVGQIAGIKDVVSFHGVSERELRNAFEEAVTDYLETCAKLGREPQKPYSGCNRTRTKYYS
jgi:predicted HicB family RNase H-like nuclease